jgi:hypothetical protein
MPVGLGPCAIAAGKCECPRPRRPEGGISNAITFFAGGGTRRLDNPGGASLETDALTGNLACSLTEGIITKYLWLIASRAFVPPCIHWMSPNGPQLSDQPPKQHDDTRATQAGTLAASFLSFHIESYKTSVNFEQLDAHYFISSRLQRIASVQSQECSRPSAI